MGSKDPLPASISRYKILKRLGEGGMGSLYLARDPEMDRLLAIKLLREDVESDELRERFKREARANARLNHQNIVIVYDVGEDMGRPFIAMEYIEGNTISGVIRGREDVPLDRKLLLMEQLCDGLSYAHRAGIVHRDIKPANLMLDGRGTLKILDFGIARIGHAAATGMTQAGTLMGTLNYMSPEQMTGRPVDHRTDIFAVGAVVYEFLAYQRAFPGDIQDGVLHRIIHEPPPPLDKFVPGIDKAVVTIVAKALEKDRENRYQDLDQMRQDIAKYRARQMLRDEPPQPRHVTHDEGTIVVRSSTAGGSGLNQLGGSTPGAVTDPKKAELLRKKQKQIEMHLNDARNALDAGDTEAVFAKCESVLMLDPDNMLAVELSEKAQTISERAKQQILLADARAALGKFDFTKAAQLVGEALVIDPTSADVLAVRKEIDSTRKRKQQQDLLAQELKARIENTKKLVAQQQYEKAIEEADAALQIDARSDEAIALKQRATAFVDEKRAKEEAARQAKAREEQQKKDEAERKRQAEEQARIARQQEEQRKKDEAERKKQQEEETRRLKAQQDEERRQQEELRKRQEAERKAQEAQRKAQDAERKAQEAERKRRQEEERRARQQQEEADQRLPGTVNLRSADVEKAVRQAQPPVPAAEREIPVPVPTPARAPAKSGGMSPVVMGGAAAAVLIVAAVGYFAFGGKKGSDTEGTGGGSGVAPTPSALTFTVTPWAHLELVGKNDPSHKAACDASPSCVVSVLPDVYNVHATNEFYEDLSFDVPVEAGKSDTFVRSFEGFKAEDEVTRLLSK